MAPTTPIKSEKTISQKLLDFFEHGWVIAALCTIGTLVGFLYTPVLAVCGIAILLAFHRVGVVRGKSWAVQIMAYGVLFMVTTSLLSGASTVIKRNIPHMPTAGEIADAVVSTLARQPKPAPVPTPTPSSPSPPKKPGLGKDERAYLEPVPTNIYYDSDALGMRADVEATNVGKLDAHAQIFFAAAVYISGRLSADEEDQLFVKTFWGIQNAAVYLEDKEVWVRSEKHTLHPVGFIEPKLDQQEAEAEKQEFILGRKVFYVFARAAFNDSFGRMELESCSYYILNNPRRHLCFGHNQPRALPSAPHPGTSPLSNMVLEPDRASLRVRSINAALKCLPGVFCRIESHIVVTNYGPPTVPAFAIYVRTFIEPLHYFDEYTLFRRQGGDSETAQGSLFYGNQTDTRPLNVATQPYSLDEMHKWEEDFKTEPGALLVMVRSQYSDNKGPLFTAECSICLGRILIFLKGSYVITKL